MAGRRLKERIKRVGKGEGRSMGMRMMMMGSVIWRMMSIDLCFILGNLDFCYGFEEN